MIEGLRDNRIFPEKDGYVFAHHLSELGMCAAGGRKFFKECGLTRLELSEFYSRGMHVDEFEQRFGHDTMARQVIDRVRNGK